MALKEYKTDVVAIITINLVVATGISFLLYNLF